DDHRRGWPRAGRLTNRCSGSACRRAADLGRPVAGGQKTSLSRGPIRMSHLPASQRYQATSLLLIRTDFKSRTEVRVFALDQGTQTMTAVLGFNRPRRATRDVSLPPRLEDPLVFARNTLLAVVGATAVLVSIAAVGQYAFGLLRICPIRCGQAS